MLYHFRGQELHGQLPHGRSSFDQAMYEDVYVAARAIEEGCVHAQGVIGWGPIGTKRSIGVFFWATSSATNHDPRFPFRHIPSVDASVLDFAGR
ncbi:MAG: hypothetical protein Q9167_007440 [Letrouitia subvulpina]